MNVSAVKERFLETFGGFYVAYGFGNAIGTEENYKVLTVSQFLAPPCMDYFFEEVSNYEQEKERHITIHADVNASYNILRKAGVAIPTDKIYFLQKEHIYPVALNVA